MDVGKGRVIGKRASNFQQRRSLSVEAAFGSLSPAQFCQNRVRPWSSYNMHASQKTTVNNLINV